ncbi:MAG: hypothetical protein QY304_01575 [Candidatus Paceibacterota bacterium]|nr:MAG: hypothetical protein QY304_01575 [Candidatus Paceibacterota bacterium]
MTKLVSDKKFVGLILTLIILFCLTLFLQIFSAPNQTFKERNLENNLTENEKLVFVGEMYFKQKEPEMPRNVLNFKKGEIVKFYNEGSVPHTVTVEEFVFDEVINPGESTYFSAEKVIENTLVTCRFHPGHRSSLTISQSSD